MHDKFMRKLLNKFDISSLNLGIEKNSQGYTMFRTWCDVKMSIDNLKVFFHNSQVLIAEIVNA